MGKIRHAPSFSRFLGQRPGVTRHFQAGEQLDVAAYACNIGHRSDAGRVVGGPKLSPLPRKLLARLLLVLQTALRRRRRVVGCCAADGTQVELRRTAAMIARVRGAVCSRWCGRARLCDPCARHHEMHGFMALPAARRRALLEEGGRRSLGAAKSREDDLLLAASDCAVAIATFGAHDAQLRAGAGRTWWSLRSRLPLRAGRTGRPWLARRSGGSGKPRLALWARRAGGTCFTLRAALAVAAADKQQRQGEGDAIANWPRRMVKTPRQASQERLSSPDVQNRDG